MKTLNSQNAPKAIGPYSQAVCANGMVYVSGQIPVNPATGELETGIDTATARCLQNIRAILAEDGKQPVEKVLTPHGILGHGPRFRVLMHSPSQHGGDR